MSPTLLLTTTALLGGAVLLTYTDSECGAALEKFQDLSDLSEADRAIAKLRLVPFYRRVCHQLDEKWDAIELNLQNLQNMQNSLPSQSQ